MTIEEFHTELEKATTYPLKADFIQKFLVHGTPIVFDGNEENYFEFRRKIALRFGVNNHEVFIVGSAKLGFSYTKGTSFSLESDVDVVIVNEVLFDDYQKKIADYQYQIDKFLKSITVGEAQQYDKFLKYFIKGWMRPDLLPNSFDIKDLREDWFKYYNSISNNKSEVGNYKVTGGLFKSMHYFEKYHMQEIDRIYNKIKMQ